MPSLEVGIERGCKVKHFFEFVFSWLKRGFFVACFGLEFKVQLGSRIAQEECALWHVFGTTKMRVPAATVIVFQVLRLSKFLGQGRVQVIGAKHEVTWFDWLRPSFDLLN